MDDQNQLIEIRKYGDSSMLKLTNRKIPKLPKGYAIIKNEYAGLNFIDTYHRTGLYKVKLPFVPGVEGGGTIAKMNVENPDLKEDDKVVYLGQYGSYAKYSIVPVEKLIKVPIGLTIKEAVAVLLQGLTAYMLTIIVYDIKSKTTCLVHAAAGGVGHLLIQMIKNRGGFVIGLVSSKKKYELAKTFGADKVIITSKKDFENEVMKITNDKGVEVVYDSIGQSTFEQSLSCLAPFGTMVSYGNASGAVPKISPLKLTDKGSIFLTRPTLFDFLNLGNNYTKASSELLIMLLSKKIKVDISKVYPLTGVSRAHNILEDRKTTGKILLKID